LQSKGIKAHRPLEEDLKLTDQAMSYDGGTRQRATVAVRNSPLVHAHTAATRTGDSTIVEWPKRNDGSPDFANMTGAQRMAYDRWRMRRYG